STDGGATWINDYQGYAGNATIGNTDCGSTPGATCKYRLHADNWLGTGPASNTLSITNPTLPGAPTRTAISGDSYGTVRLTWTPPSSNGGAPLLGYELDRSTDGGATWINDYQGYAGNATIGNTDCGSTPGATCKYRLHADNWLGTGPASNTLSITNPTLPGAPTLTAISGDSYGTVRLTWTPPSSNGGAPLLGYELDRSTDGGATWINDYQGYAGNATIGNTDCGSTPGATCKYRLHADNWL